MPSFICKGTVKSISHDGAKITFTLHASIYYTPSEEGTSNANHGDKLFNIFFSEDNSDHPKHLEKETQIIADKHFLPLLTLAKSEQGLFKIDINNRKLSSLQVGQL